MHAARNAILFLAAGLAAVVAPGCSAPPATLELIAVARQGLAHAEAAEAEHHAQAAARLDTRRAALDAAFDADVRLVAAGRIRGEGGAPVELTPDWVISARKGYAAARDALADHARRAEADHAVRLDNLRAADEALDLAADLILRRQNLTARARRLIMNLHRRSIHHE